MNCSPSYKVLLGPDILTLQTPRSAPETVSSFKLEAWWRRSDEAFELLLKPF